MVILESRAIRWSVESIIRGLISIKLASVCYANKKSLVVISINSMTVSFTKPSSVAI